MSQWHLAVLRDMIVLSVLNELWAQKLQPMMFYTNNSGPTDSHSYTLGGDIGKVTV